jgi:hypothetical protein
LRGLPVFDADFLPGERFPRRLTIEFVETDSASGSGRAASLKLVDAEPCDLLTVPSAVGDRLTDNSRRNDGYRYHDAIHLGFLAVLGWSPITRAMLHLKRKSLPDVDEAEDGARAIFAEGNWIGPVFGRADVSA